MKNMLYIEELIKLNNKISLYNLIYKKFKLHWWLIIILSFVPAIVVYILAITENYWWLFICIPLTIIFTIGSAKYMVSKVRFIIERDYNYALNENNDYNYHSMLEIQKNEVIHFFGDNMLKKDNLLFLINSLTENNRQKNYSYLISINTIIILIGVITGPFLGKFFDFAINIDELKEAFGNFLISLLLLCYLFIVVDIIIIKPLVYDIRKNRNRIVRILENIYLEKFTCEDDK